MAAWCDEFIILAFDVITNQKQLHSNDHNSVSITTTTIIKIIETMSRADPWTGWPSILVTLSIETINTDITGVVLTQD